MWACAGKQRATNLGKQILEKLVADFVRGCPFLFLFQRLHQSMPQRLPGTAHLCAALRSMQKCRCVCSPEVFWSCTGLVWRSCHRGHPRPSNVGFADCMRGAKWHAGIAPTEERPPNRKTCEVCTFNHPDPGHWLVVYKLLSLLDQPFPILLFPFLMVARLRMPNFDLANSVSNFCRT